MTFVGTKSSNYSANGNEIIVYDESATFNITLPAASSNSGKQIWLLHLNANVAGTVNVVRSGSDVIAFTGTAATSTSYDLIGLGGRSAVILVSDGSSKWYALFGGTTAQ
jgi:hypothetical protein